MSASEVEKSYTFSLTEYHRIWLEKIHSLPAKTTIPKPLILLPSESWSSIIWTSSDTPFVYLLIWIFNNSSPFEKTKISDQPCETSHPQDFPVFERPSFFKVSVSACLLKRYIFPSVEFSVWTKKYVVPFCTLSKIFMTISSSGISSQTAIFPFTVRIPTPEFTPVEYNSTFCISEAVTTDEEYTAEVLFIPEKLLQHSAVFCIYTPFFYVFLLRIFQKNKFDFTFLNNWRQKRQFLICYILYIYVSDI